MPYIERPVEKLYYTIGEVAEMLEENASLVRFWASSFPDFIKPARNKKGNRLFTQQDVTNFKFIHHLVKEQGMTLEGAAKRMRENRDGDDKRIEVIERLTAIKLRLQNIADEYSVEEASDEVTSVDAVNSADFAEVVDAATETFINEEREEPAQIKEERVINIVESKENEGV